MTCKVIKFRLIGYSNIFNQVIIGGSKILVEIELNNYNGELMILDISNYSKQKYINIKSNKFFKIIDVDFLGEEGLECGKNDLNSRISLKIGNDIFYSNTIGDYIYKEDFLDKNSNFYNIGDHHLGVYNKFENDFLIKTETISKYRLYKNDITFINRSKYFFSHFININNEFNYIIKNYLINYKKGIKTIFYIDIFIQEVNNNILNNLYKIIKICKLGTYYIYNIDYKLYLEKINFDKKYYLYNYHFKPLKNNNIIYSGKSCFIWNPNINYYKVIEEKYNILGEEIDFWYFKNYNKNKKLYINKINTAIIGCSIALGSSGKNMDKRFSTIINNKNNNNNNNNINIINYATGYHNIAEVYIQYYKFVKNKNFNKVIYIYGNDNFYFCKKIDGNRYITPIIYDNGIEYNIKNNYFLYIDYLLDRFKKFINELLINTNKYNQDFIVLISPPSIKHPRFKEIKEIDDKVYKILLSMGINVFNLYNLNIFDRNYYFDNDFHLNEKGHIFYANYIEKRINE